MELHELISVSNTTQPGTYFVMVEMTDADGIRQPLSYTLNPDDQHGLAPLIRQAVDDWIAAGNTPATYMPPVPTEADVDVERDRRIADGFTFAGVAYQSRPEDRENIAGAATAALGAIMNGAVAGDLRWHGGASDFLWIAADNSTHTMDAHTVFAFGQAAMEHKQAHIFAGRALKETTPIPETYTDDAHWP